MKNHTSVLLKEVLEYLEPKEGDIVIDATYGFGGHSKKISELVGDTGKIVAFEQDAAICKIVKQDLPVNVTLINDNFSNYKEHIERLGISRIDKALFDLGISSWHFDKSGRGFSFKGGEDLDMRLNLADSFNAKDIVNKYSEQELADIFYYLSDEYESRRLAKAIIEYRENKDIESTSELAEIINKAKKSRSKIHPATKVFQALRIEVNMELSVLKRTLEGMVLDLSKDGRMCVISFHSKEDAITKNIFKHMKSEGEVELLNKKPIEATDEEKKENPRSRSAKLRAIKKKK